MVEDERYLLQLVAHIHLNPVAAGVVPDPAEYRYSCHRELLGATTASLVDAESTLALHGDTVRTARRAGEIRLAEAAFRAASESLDERL